MGERRFLPFGEFLPDRSLLLNEGLIKAYGVVPIAGNYMRRPKSESPAAGQQLDSSPPYGFHVHSSLASGLVNTYGYYGTETELYEIDLVAQTEADRSRTVGGAYAFASSPPGSYEFWWFTSYGDNVVATNFEDAVQYQSAPGSNFADMITSTFVPRAALAFPIRVNLFLAFIGIDVSYDGLSTGTHPQMVCWSQNDNIQAFGSENVDASLVGAGYQQLFNDLGPITAGIGGDFGIVFQVGGITRIDGPPYEFRTISVGDSTLYPYSVFRINNDVYFWGNSGPSVLYGGEPPVVKLGEGKILRALMDNTTEFGQDFSRASTLNVREVSGAADMANGLVRWSYLPITGSTIGDPLESGAVVPSLAVDYSTTEKRFTINSAEYSTTIASQHLFLRSKPGGVAQAWYPYRDLYFISRLYQDGVFDTYWYRNYILQQFGAELVPIDLQTGYHRLSEQATSRITAVRLVYSCAANQGATIDSITGVNIYTKNKFGADATTTPSSGSFTDVNDDGWVVTDDAVFGSIHSIRFQLTPTNNPENTALELIHEIEGVEVEYVVGGRFGN